MIEGVRNFGECEQIAASPSSTEVVAALRPPDPHCPPAYPNRRDVDEGLVGPAFAQIDRSDADIPGPVHENGLVHGSFRVAWNPDLGRAYVRRSMVSLMECIERTRTRRGQGHGLRLAARIPACQSASRLRRDRSAE